MSYADCFNCGHRWSDHTRDTDGGSACNDGRCGCEAYVAAAEVVEGLDVITEAASGSRGPDQRRIAREGARWLALLLRKNQDYGSSAWKIPALAPDLAARDAILCRMSDKIERLARLRDLGTEASAVAESYEDTMRDLGAYALLWLCAPEEGGDV